MTPDFPPEPSRFSDRQSPAHAPQTGTSRALRPESRELFRHVSAERSSYYRSILDVFALAKRQYRLQLRPDEVLAEATWPGSAPRIEDVNLLLTQLAEWGNLESQADTSRVSSLSDFYRARYLYRLSHGGEAVEAGLGVFVQTLKRRAELRVRAEDDRAAIGPVYLVLIAVKLWDTEAVVRQITRSSADNRCPLAAERSRERRHPAPLSGRARRSVRFAISVR